MNSLSTKIICALALMHTVEHYAASSSSGPSSSFSSSSSVRGEPLWKLSVVSGQTDSSSNIPDHVVIERERAGERVSTSVRLNLSERDYFTTQTFQEHLADEKGFTVLGLFQYVRSDGMSIYDFAYGPSLQEYVIQQHIKGLRVIHPTNRYPLVGLPECYLIEHEDESLRSTYLGMMSERIACLPIALGLILKQEKSLNDLLAIGRSFQDSGNYHCSLIWFERAMHISQRVGAPYGDIITRIVSLHAALQKWSDVLRTGENALVKLQPHDTSNRQQIERDLAKAYLALVGTGASEQRWQDVLELAGRALERGPQADLAYRSRITELIIEAHSRLGAYEEAIEVSKGDLIALAEDAHTLRAGRLFKIGQLYEALQKAPLAFAYYDRAYGLLGSEKDGIILAHLLLIFDNEKDTLGHEADDEKMFECAETFLAMSRDERKKVSAYFARSERSADYMKACDVAENLLLKREQQKSQSICDDVPGGSEKCTIV